jgi:hypothetical protein
LAIGAAPAALLIWTAYLAWLTNDPLVHLHQRITEPWERAASLPWTTLRSAVEYLSESGLSRLSRTVNTLDLAVAVLLIEASIVAWWRLPRAYAIYLTASTCLLLSSTVARWPLQSLARYSLVLFPLFLLLAQLGANRYWHRAILIVSASMLGMCTALFATWYWIF